MRRVILLAVVASGCFVKVPEIHEGTFACEADGDCAKDYVCRARVCVHTSQANNNAQACAGCGGNTVCALRSDGNAQCITYAGSPSCNLNTHIGVDVRPADGTQLVHACLACPQS